MHLSQRRSLFFSSSSFEMLGLIWLKQCLWFGTGLLTAIQEKYFEHRSSLADYRGMDQNSFPGIKVLHFFSTVDSLQNSRLDISWKETKRCSTVLPTIRIFYSIYFILLGIDDSLLFDGIKKIHYSWDVHLIPAEPTIVWRADEQVTKEYCLKYYRSIVVVTKLCRVSPSCTFYWV